LLFYFSLGRTVGVYLIADWLILWGALGAVVTFELALLELSKFTVLSRAVFAILLAVAMVSVVVSRLRSSLEVLCAPPAKGVAEVLPAKPARRGWKVG